MCKKSRMKNIIRSLLLILLLSCSGTLISQDVVKVLDQVYGLDQTLCNGRKYLYLAPAGSNGHQYLVSPDYITGSVTLMGKCYQDISLNYDILNQQLLLKYNDGSGIPKIIDVSKAWLKSFSLGAMNFEFLSLDKEPRFFQTLGEGQVRILYFWRKTLNIDGSVGSYHFTFTRALRDSYVFMDGQLKQFRTKRSLIRLFEPAHRPEIKSYLRKNKVNVRKSSDQAMAAMIAFIGNIR